jgi:7-alpha-hydroxysteroid dehydrogenase
MAGLDDFSLDGLVALIPGGGGGIGSALAVALAEAGASVVVGGRTQASLDATVGQVKAAGREGLAVVADATDEAGSERMVSQAVERFGRLDILINAVGGGAG